MTAYQFDTAIGARMDQITPTTPLLLEDAAKIASPGGNMTALILRRQAAKGNLTIEKIGNRVYTTLADVEEMRKRCRVNPKDQGSGPEKVAGATTTSVTPLESALALADSLMEKHRKPPRATPPKSSKGR